MKTLQAMPITPTCTSPKIAPAILGEAGGGPAGDCRARSKGHGTAYVVPSGATLTSADGSPPSTCTSAVREIAAFAALAQKDMGPKNRLGDFWKGGLTLFPNEGYLRVSRRA